MATNSPGYSITIRVETPSTAGLTAAINVAGASLTALDVVESHPTSVVVDVTCDAADADHADQATQSISDLHGVLVHKVSDRTFLLHRGGKIEVFPRVHLKHRGDMYGA